ncbi:MAG: carboxypeptidase regulatory-like domain-containing protein, partial [Cryomorphaceae bacterium]
MPDYIKSYFFIFCSILPLLGFGQVEVSGQLIDNANDQPVAFAQIALMTTDSTIVTGAQSDINGNFTVSAESGNYLLKAVFIGYEHFY